MPKGFGVKLTGDWEKAKEIVGTLPQKFDIAAERAMFMEAQFLRAELVKYIAGSEIKPLSPKTIAIRRFAGFKGTKPLIRRADLRNSIRISKAPGGGVFVGIHKNAKSKDGQSLVNIALLMENGSKPFVIHITAKSSRFYHAAMAKAGISLSGGHAHGGGGYPIVVVRIPARPIFGPVFAKHAQPDAVRQRFFERVSKMLYEASKKA